MTSGRRNLHSPSPTTLLTIDYRPPSWYNFLSLPSLPLPLKQKIAATIFAKKILSIRSPKLRFLCRLASFPCLLPSFLERLRANRAELILKQLFFIQAPTCSKSVRGVMESSLKQIYCLVTNQNEENQSCLLLIIHEKHKQHGQQAICSKQVLRDISPGFDVNALVRLIPCTIVVCYPSFSQNESTQCSCPCCLFVIYQFHKNYLLYKLL